MRISFEDLQDPSEGITLDRRNVEKLLAEHGMDITPEFLDECKRKRNTTEPTGSANDIIGVRISDDTWHSSDVMNWLGY